MSDVPAPLHSEVAIRNARARQNSLSMLIGGEITQVLMSLATPSTSGLAGTGRLYRNPSVAVSWQATPAEGGLYRVTATRD